VKWPGVLGCAALLAVLGGSMLRGPGAIDDPPPAAAQGAHLRIVLPSVSRDVFPDVVVEQVAFLSADIFEAAFRYRVRNIGDAAADLAKFTMQAWFSEDAALDKGTDLEAEVIGFAVSLAPGAVLEAEATATNGEAPVSSHLYLLLELDSAGAVTESDTSNNVRAARRPPLDLLRDVELAWDEDEEEATVSWTFNGAAHGIGEGGFRVEAPGFGTQEVPAGTRSVTVPFNPFTGARPCLAKVTVLSNTGPPWPPVETNRLCQ
jgi:hypothetical protein